MYAKASGFPVHYFPSEYDVLDEVPKSHITQEKIPQEWLNEWIALWPTPAQIKSAGGHLDYSISGNAPEVKKRMAAFVKEFCERLGQKDCDLDFKLDIIWKATQAYLSHLERTEYEFAKKNVKFIKDTNGSVLEDWCNRVLSKTHHEEREYFRV